MSALILGLGGCGGMKLHPLKPVSKKAADYKKEKEGVEVRIYKLDKSECPLRKYKACILTVHNKGLHKLRVKESAFGCELPDEDEIYALLSQSVGGRVFGTLLTGSLICSAALDGGCLYYGVNPILSLLGTGLFLSSIPLGINASSYNNQLQLYLDKYMFKGFRLSPGNQKTRIVFIPKFAHEVIPFTVTQIIKSSKTIKKEPIEFNVKI